MLTDLLGSQYLFEILQTSLTVNSTENLVNSKFFKKHLQWRVPNFFRNEGGIYLFCKNIDILVNYW